MKIKYLWILNFIVLIGCTTKNNNKDIKITGTTIYSEDAFSSPLQGSVYYEKDGQLKLYDSILPTEPFSYVLSPENITKTIPFLDSINKKDCSDEYVQGSIITYYIHNSYLKIFKNIENNNYIPIDFIILDKNITLRNGLKVGLARDVFNSIYPAAIKYNNLTEISIVDESEFTSINCFFQEDTISKITFYDVEFQVCNIW